MEEVRDERFSHIATDPRFRRTPKSVRKVQIDKRFQSLFTDKRFQVKYNIDKRGRPVNQSSQENYKKFYDLLTDEEFSEEDDEEEGTEYDTGTLSSQCRDKTKQQIISKCKDYKSSKPFRVNKWVVTPTCEFECNRDINNERTRNSINEASLNVDHNINNSRNKEIDLEADEIVKARMTDEIKMKLRNPNIDYARGVGALISDSSSEEESTVDSESDNDDVEHSWGELDRDAELTQEPTDRLAVLHMDWDRIRAVDLMVLFSSFLPPEGVIDSVAIYPSEFGLMRMKEEEEKGPVELVNVKSEDIADLAEENKEGKQYHMERLRQYQLNRLKYYYAIIKFDSADTASKIYTECDGLEYESSATKFDLRFVPQEETFDQEPKEVCTNMPDPTKYEPRLFTNTALQQGKVELTWDETDPGRKEFTKKIQKNAEVIDDADLQAYLAYSSEEDDEENQQDEKGIKINFENGEQENVKEEDNIARYKSILVSLEEEEEKKRNRDVDLEISWGVGLKEKAEKSIKEKINAPQSAFEEMIKKRKENRKIKKEEKLRLKEKINGSEDNLYSDDDIPSDVDMSDLYFKEEQGSKPHKNKKNKFLTEDECLEEKQKRAELELLLLEENESEKQKNHFNIKTIQSKETDANKKKRRKQLKKKPQEINTEKDVFEVDVADDRFSALYTSHLFNVDPADPHYRKTKGVEAILSEKLKRRKQDNKYVFQCAKQTKADPELLQHVKSIKCKTINK